MAGTGFFSGSLSIFDFLMNNSVVSGSKAYYSRGGAFATYHFGTSIALFNNTLFENNQALGGPGGIFAFMHTAGDFKFENSRFIKNAAIARAATGGVFQAYASA